MLPLFTSKKNIDSLKKNYFTPIKKQRSIILIKEPGV